MYEFLILGQLSRRPMHGYMIAKIIGNIIGPFRQIQWGTLYPVLNRLENEGLIRAEENPEESDSRSRKVYAITDSGIERLREYLLDTEHHMGEYNMLFPHKVAFFHRLTADERLRLSRHYAVYAQQHIDHLERKLRDLQLVPQLSADAHSDLITVMNHAIDRWTHERTWAEDLIAKQKIKETA